MARKRPQTKKRRQQLQKLKDKREQGFMSLRGEVKNGVECSLAIAVESPVTRQRVMVSAIVDTGCTAIAIRPDIAAKLGLPVVDTRLVGTASSGTTRIKTDVVVGALLLEKDGRTALSLQEMLVADMENEMLFGMAGMRGGILTVDLVKNRWEWKLLTVNPIGPVPSGAPLI